MRQGALTRDPITDRMDVRFGPDQYYGGLHCGRTLDVLVGGHWKATRIEMDDDWYLVGVKTDKLEGLVVRI